MENLNLPPFYVGQKVVYITGHAMPKNSIHTIKSIVSHQCGCYSLDIGVSQDRSYKGLKCPDHGPTLERIIGNVKYFKATSFRPLQEATMPLLTYSKVLEKVPVCSN